MAYDGTLKFDTKIDSSGFQAGVSKLGNLASTGLKATGAILGGAVTAIASIGTAAIKAGSEFEAGMSEVQAISGASASDMEKLTAKAKEMGSKTKFSASESAEAFTYMAMAGWKTGDMLDGIEGIMNLAAASGEDLATTSDIVTDALTAFGMQASDSGHFADVLAAASSNANTNVGMLGESFKYVAPVAGALGYSAEDTSVALGLMANSGIKASQAGTSLRAIMNRLVKPTKESSAAMDALGISLTDSNGNMKSFDEVMGDLRHSFSGLTEAEKAEMAAMLAGQEAMSGLLAIVNASDDDFNKLRDSIYDCDGAAKDMADTMNDNLKGQITLLKSALEGLGISLYEEMQEPLKDIVKEANNMVGELQKAFNNGGLDAMVGKAGEIFAGVVVKAAEVAPKLVDAALNLVYSFCGGLLDHRSEIGKAGAELITSLVTALFDCAREIWSTAIALAGWIATGLADGAPEIVGSAVDCISFIIECLAEWMPHFMDAGAAIIRALAEGLADALPDIASFAISIIHELSEGLAKVIPDLIPAAVKCIVGLVNAFNENIDLIICAGINIIKAIGEGLVRAIPDLVANLPQIMEAIALTIGAFKLHSVGGGIIESLKDGIKTKGGMLIDSVTSTVSGALKSIAKTALSSVASALPGVLSSIGGALSSIGSTIISGISSALPTILSTIGGALSSVGSSIVSGIGSVITTSWVFRLAKVILQNSRQQ